MEQRTGSTVINDLHERFLVVRDKGEVVCDPYGNAIVWPSREIAEKANQTYAFGCGKLVPLVKADRGTVGRLRKG